MDSEAFTEEFKKHFGEIQGGANLKQALENLPLADLLNLHDSISKIKEGSRIFFLGNGGSFDNARFLASVARESGFNAKTPWHEVDYDSLVQKESYAEIFSEALKKDNLNSSDIVIGLSGSGNSTNVLKALSYAVAIGAETFAVGGRDGGIMRTVVEKDHCILAAHDCMEVIEDTNNFMILSVFNSLKEEVSLTSSVLNILKQFQEFLNGNNFQKLGEIAAGIVGAYKRKGRTFVLGAGIGCNHFRADLSRGATDTVPINGLNVPEVYTTNSYMATANDDGSDFILASGLSNFQPSDSDFALVFENESGNNRAEYCKELLESKEVQYISVGPNGLDISSFDKDLRSFAVTMVGHSCSIVLNKYFKESFKVRELSQTPGFSEGQKKLGIKETSELEEKYKSAGLITANEVLSFSHGKVFAVSSSEPFERNFF